MGSPSQSQRPNILLVVADQHRGDFMPWNKGLPLRTPTLRELASRGVTFRRATTPSPLCAPARACLASGRDYRFCGVRDNGEDFPIGSLTYYQLLRDGGYSVGGVGKFDLHKATQHWALDGSRRLAEWGFTVGIDNEGKFDGVRSGATEPRGPYMAMLHRRGLAAAHVDDYRARHPYRSTHATPLPDDAYCDNWITENALSVLKGFGAGQPWHLAVNFAGPHDPMDVTASMIDALGDASFPVPEGLSDNEAEIHRAIRRNYAAMIENIDRNIEKLLEAVDRRGEFENTVVIYTSDHGEMLGDHGLWGKSTWRQASLWIPLVVSGPDVVAGAQSDGPVSLHDVAATVLSYAGIEAPAGMESVSMRQVLAGQCRTHRTHVTSGLTLGGAGAADLGHYGVKEMSEVPGSPYPSGWSAVFDGRFKLVRSASGWSRVFDLEQDPGETEDLGENSGVGSVLAGHLDKWVPDQARSGAPQRRGR